MPEMPENSPYLLDQSPAYILMTENPARIVKPIYSIQSQHNHTQLRSPASSFGPRRTTKTKLPIRSSPYSLSKAVRTKLLNPAPTKPEVCALIGCRIRTSHSHTNEEIKGKIGWYPLEEDVSGVDLSPINEYRLQKYLNKKLPFERVDFKDKEQRLRTNVLDVDDNEAVVDLRATLPGVGYPDELLENGVTRELIRSTGGNHKGGPFTHPSRPTNDDSDISTGWPCDKYLSCRIMTPHKHTSDEVITKLGHIPTVKDSSYGSSALTRTLGAQFLDIEAGTQKLPDMQWRPCSMLDSYSTSTDTLRFALPSIPAADDDRTVTTVTTSPPRSPAPQRIKNPPSSRGHGTPERETASSPRKLAKGVGKQVTRSHSVVPDIQGATARMENLSIKGKEGSDTEAFPAESGDDPLRSWFKRCGYIQ